MTAPLPPDLWARVEEIFASVVDLPPRERRAALERQAPDPRVLREVESLLGFAGDRPADAFHGIVEEEARRLEAARGEVDDRAGEGARVGSRIGRYRVVREIGRGGMGVVYLGRREGGDFEQQVAIKLLPGALFDQGMTRRFRNERRILASLEHPGVARFLDGGTTPAGVPWVAMEYVDGEPIDAYCDRKALDLDALLALFDRVCDAVRYAHGKLIVHRDLKPDNILVDEEGEPKLLDFGIARLLDPEDEEGRTATLIMTPRYASPEQIAGQIVTTSTDIYSLGALLYLLISGHTPHEEVTSRSELLYIVAREDPVAPSQAAGRPDLAGDLDTIVLTAMRRDPDERYPSVDRLQQDVQAYRASKPIAARPHTLAYRARRFIARNRAAALAGAAAVLALLVGGGAATVGLVQARTAEAAAREEALVAAEVTEFLVDLFEDPTPRVSGGEERTARQLLDRGVERIGAELDGQPALQARLRRTMGTSYAGLGDYRRADTLFSLALETAPPEHAALRASILAAQGNARRNAGELDGALEALDDAAALSAVRVDTTDSASLARTPTLTRALIDALRETGVVLAMRGAHAQAIDTLRRAHRLTLRAFAEGSELEARSAGTLAYGYIMADRKDDAIPLYERRAEILAEQGERSAAYLIAMDNLGAAYAANGELDQARTIYERILP
ncbi:MAG: serine/threonine-protein kinase, partial [Gemmatimonadota bacterium]